jgi:hypothetical protein
MAAGAGAQAASLRESRARARASSELMHGMLHVYVLVCSVFTGARHEWRTPISAVTTVLRDRATARVDGESLKPVAKDCQRYDTPRRTRDKE